MTPPTLVKLINGTYLLLRNFFMWFFILFSIFFSLFVRGGKGDGAGGGGVDKKGGNGACKIYVGLGGEVVAKNS